MDQWLIHLILQWIMDRLYKCTFTNYAYIIYNKYAHTDQQSDKHIIVTFRDSCLVSHAPSDCFKT